MGKLCPVKYLQMLLILKSTLVNVLSQGAKKCARFFVATCR